MAGHSKWANIKHRKAAQDKKRGKLYTKLIREITVAARLGGGNPEDNPRLRASIDKALSANMPKATIDRAVQRGAGGGEDSNVEELVYEGYATGGVAVLVEAITDNRNRTVAEVRHAFSKFGGNLGTDGSVAYLFSRIGLVSFESEVDEDLLLNLAIESRASDVEFETGLAIISVPWEELADLKQNLVDGGLPPDNAEIVMVAANQIDCDIEQSEKALKLIDALEDLDDVQNVFTNGNFAEEAYGE